MRSITRAMSIGARSAIVATFVTTLIIPVVDSAHHLVGHAYKAGGSKQVNCFAGQPVTVGTQTFTCQSRLVSTIKVATGMKLCPKTLWWVRGRCASWAEYLRAHSLAHSARTASASSP